MLFPPKVNSRAIEFPVPWVTHCYPWDHHNQEVDRCQALPHCSQPTCSVASPTTRKSCQLTQDMEHACEHRCVSSWAHSSRANWIPSHTLCPCLTETCVGRAGLRRGCYSLKVWLCSKEETSRLLANSEHVSYQCVGLTPYKLVRHSVMREKRRLQSRERDGVTPG